MNYGQVLFAVMLAMLALGSIGVASSVLALVIGLFYADVVVAIVGGFVLLVSVGLVLVPYIWFVEAA